MVARSKTALTTDTLICSLNCFGHSALKLVMPPQNRYLNLAHPIAADAVPTAANTGHRMNPESPKSSTKSLRSADPHRTAIAISSAGLISKAPKRRLNQDNGN